MNQMISSTKTCLLLSAIIISVWPCTLESSDFPENTPESQGVSSSSILEFIDRLEHEIDSVHSFMILRHGRLISQGWWQPYGPDLPHVMNSLSKSFTSTAVGFAIQEGLFSLDDLVISFFPDKVPQKRTWHWNEMRVRDLLTMNTGHIKEPRDREAADWITSFLESNVELIPGTVFKYNSMATYMLSAIVQKTSRQNLVDYLEPRFFKPLGIKKPRWDTCPQGIAVGGWGLYVQTEDVAKLGQFYLQEGVWNGKQLLNREWIQMATSKQVNNGSHPENDWAQGYGFQFWRCRHNAYRGDGASGQFCIVMPDQDAVVAITSGARDMAAIMRIVWETLLPGMKPEALGENEKSWKALKQKTSHLELKPVTGERTSNLSYKISNKRFLIQSNQAGIQSLRLGLDGAPYQVLIDTGKGKIKLPIGFGNHAEGTLDQLLPFTNDQGNKVAASGAWTAGDTYQLRIFYRESTARLTYTFTFSDHRVVWRTKMEHVLFANRNIPDLIGELE